MEKLYNRVSIYYKKNEIIYLMPIGECIAFCGADTIIEPIEILNLPTNQELLLTEIEKCFDNCWKKVVTEIPKGLNIFEKLAKVKSRKQAVSTFDYLSLTLDKTTHNYSLAYNWKKQKSYYENPDNYEMNDKIDFNFILSLIQG